MGLSMGPWYRFCRFFFHEIVGFSKKYRISRTVLRGNVPS